ncbi:13193_t:CDS:2 [Cetraspora pellucida]|uniref:13193_t:CDS:1 n=1 Tax=Cetraspora pellucida TaxID=1433469 RepID=A0A9N9FT19_9GLOM|nr:13193_t:CDS:2 [Cetraspora pellucida]
MFFRIESFTTQDYLNILLLILLFYIVRFYHNYFTRPNPLPGPLSLPFGLENLFYDGDLKRFATTLYNKYGDICEFRLGGYRRIVLSKPDYFENLLTSSKNLALFTKHEYSPAMDMLGSFGRGLFLNNNYETWKINKYFFLQSVSTPSFNDDAIKRNIDLFEELDGYWNLLAKSQSCNDGWFEMDFLPWINRFMSDNISIIVIGERGLSMGSYYNTFNSDKSKLESSSLNDPKLFDSDKFTRAIMIYMRGIIFFHIVPPFLRRYVPFFKKKADALLENRDFILRTIENVIEKRKNDLVNTPQKLKSMNDLLTILITANNDAKNKEAESLTEEDIRTLLLDVFFAGSDTSSNTLCYIIYFICHNPHVKQKMFDEIDSVFPNNSSITADLLAKLKYCDAIIKEASRMMPVLPVSKRVATGECEVAGYTWPAKTIFQLNYASIHMNEKYWDNPTVFDPNRFSLQNDSNEFDYLNNLDKENKKSTHNANKYSLVIFGGGIRMCPGRKLAMINMLSFMVLMFKKYDIELVDREAPLKTHSAFLTNCLELKIKIQPRKLSL